MRKGDYKKYVWGAGVTAVLCCAVVGVYTIVNSLFVTAKSSETPVIRVASHDAYTDAHIEPVTFYSRHNKGSSRKIARKGLLYRRPHARATILICHGFMCGKTDIRFLQMLFERYNVMLFDFRAHGEMRDGQCCTFGHDEVFDIKAAAQFIKSDRELGRLPLIVYGFSMGAVSSINAQSQDETLFDCAIWDCPFDSTEGLLCRSIANLKISLFGYSFELPGRSFFKKFAYNRFVQACLKTALKAIANMDATQVNARMVRLDTVEAAKKIEIPAFFITCRKDEKAPPAAVRKVFDSAKGYKRFWITNGRSHFDSFFWSPERYRYHINTFIKKFLDGDLQRSAHRSKIYEDSPDMM